MSNGTMSTYHFGSIILQWTGYSQRAVGVRDGGHKCSAITTNNGFGAKQCNIQPHIRPGTVVWSDEWRAYHRVQNLPAVRTPDCEALDHLL